MKIGARARSGTAAGRSRSIAATAGMLSTCRDAAQSRKQRHRRCLHALLELSESIDGVWMGVLQMSPPPATGTIGTQVPDTFFRCHSHPPAFGNRPEL